MKKVIFILGLLLIPTIAFAQLAKTSTAVAALTPEDLPGLISLMANAFSSGNAMIGSGLLLTLAVAAFKMFGLNKLFHKKYNKWVAGGLAMVTSIAVGLMAQASLWVILSTGVGIGVTAIGGWELLLEPAIKLLKRKWPSVFKWLPGDADPS